MKWMYLVEVCVSFTNFFENGKSIIHGWVEHNISKHSKFQRMPFQLRMNNPKCKMQMTSESSIVKFRPNETIRLNFSLNRGQSKRQSRVPFGQRVWYTAFRVETYSSHGHVNSLLLAHDIKHHQKTHIHSETHTSISHDAILFCSSSPLYPQPSQCFVVPTFAMQSRANQKMQPFQMKSFPPKPPNGLGGPPPGPKPPLPPPGKRGPPGPMGS